jgi:hypothetical protein
MVWLALSQCAAARDIFVDNVRGDDRYDGASPTTGLQGSGPCRTISHALRLAGSADRIILADSGQPYRESITLQAARHSGNQVGPFTIDGGGAVLDGAGAVPDYAWEHYQTDVFRFQPARMSYQQIFRDGVPLERRLASTQYELPALEPLQWCLFDRYIYFRVEKDKLPQSYGLSHAAQPVGITLYDVRGVVIRDLTVQGFQLDGINAHDNVFDCTLLGVVCRGNGRAGVSIGGASRVLVEACLLGNNGAAQLRTEGYSETRVVDCDLIDNTAPAIVRDGGRLSITEPPGATEP